VRHFRLPPTVLPLPYRDEELRGVTAPTLLLIGQQEALYDPVAAVERAKRLIADIDTELIPQAGHDLPPSQPATVNARVLGFLKDRRAARDRIAAPRAGAAVRPWSACRAASDTRN
jgi:pimeloyl-ACP methyl ester carboxylesterase